MKRPIAFICLSPPGGGKGTLVERLSKRIQSAGHTLFQTDTGSIFRKTIKKELDAIIQINDANRKRLKEIQDCGELQSAAPAIAMWVTDFFSGYQFTEEFILMDGSPRKIEEWYAQHEFLKLYCKADIRYIEIAITNEAAMHRMEERHKTHPRPETESREKITHRMDQFHLYCKPTIDAVKELYLKDATLVDKFIPIDNNGTLEALEAQVQTIVLS